jgi:hypothetical protein
MEEVKNQDKKEGHHHGHNNFRDCLGGHCHNCSMGHKIAKVLIVIFIVWALISIGVAMGSRFSRFEGGGEGFGKRDFMMQGQFENRGNFSKDGRGGCGRQAEMQQFNNQVGGGGCPMQNIAQPTNGGCALQAGGQCNNPGCPLNQANPEVPVTPDPLIQ